MTGVFFRGRPAPSQREIFTELRQVSEAMVAAETTGELMIERENADRLLDLYIDLGYMALRTSSTLHLTPAPPQGYQEFTD